MAQTVWLGDGTYVTRFWAGENGFRFEIGGHGERVVLAPTTEERERLAALILGGDEEPRPRSLFQRAAELLEAARREAVTR